MLYERRNLGLELRVDFQIDHTHTPLSLLLRLFFLPEKGRNILLCGFQLEQFFLGFLVLLVELCLFGCSQVCKFVKDFRPDLLGVCTAGIEVPCKLVQVAAHLAALSKPAKVCQEVKAENLNKNNCCRVQ